MGNGIHAKGELFPDMNRRSFVRNTDQEEIIRRTLSHNRASPSSTNSANASRDPSHARASRFRSSWICDDEMISLRIEPIRVRYASHSTPYWLSSSLRIRAAAEGEHPLVEIAIRRGPRFTTAPE